MDSHLYLEEEFLLLLSPAFNLSPTLCLEMTGFKAFFATATVEVEMQSDAHSIGISEITLPIAWIQIRTFLVLFLSVLLE